MITRYQAGLWVASWNSSEFPWATLLINVVGSFALGFLIRYLVVAEAAPDIRIMLTTGFCGGFTTLSTFSYEFVNLLMGGQRLMAFAYMGSTMSASPAACYLGFLLAGAR